MPRRGRPPAPTQLKMIRGDQPSRINRTPPLPLTEPPRCPDWLTADGDRADFDRVAEQLYRAGIAKLIDSDAIAMYVRTAAVWRQADALVGQAGVLIRDRDGDARRNPALLAPRQYAEETRRWMVELGLTASARDSLQASMPASGLPGERLLTGR